MATDALAQALREASWGTAEADVYDVIARLTDLPRAAVVRVAYLLLDDPATTDVADPEVYDAIPFDVRQAYDHHLLRGLQRVRVRRALAHAPPRGVYVRAAALVTHPADISRGCVKSIMCVTTKYSTPADCLDGEFAASDVIPLKIVGDKVTGTCTQPLGTFTFDVGDLE